jgi:hypothetical protein
MSDKKDTPLWQKGDPPVDIGWDDDEDDAPPRTLSPDEKILHDENMAKLNRIMRAYGILKIGLTALVIVIIIKVFGR